MEIEQSLRIARDELGIDVALLRKRFETSGWKYTGEGHGRCPYCGYVLHVARKPYTASYLAETRLYRCWALICPSCQITFDPRELRDRADDLHDDDEIDDGNAIGPRPEVSLAVPPDLLEALADRLAELLATRLERGPKGSR